MGFIFQHFLRKRSFQRWAKFNLIPGVGLDAGTEFGVIAMFFALLVSKVTPLTACGVY